LTWAGPQVELDMRVLTCLALLLTTAVSRSGADSLLDSGLVSAFGAAADPAGRVWVAVAGLAGQVRLLRSADCCRTWDDPLRVQFDSGVGQLAVVPAFGESSFIHVFVLSRQNSGDLWLWRVRPDGSASDLLPLAVGPDTVDDFSAVADRDSFYYIYCLYANERRTGQTGRFVRSTDFGRSWGMATDWWNCWDPHISHTRGSTIHCVWRYALTGTEIHYQSNRHYGAARYWSPRRVVSGGNDRCWDPVVVEADTASQWDATVWAFYTVGRRDTSHTDIGYSRSWNCGWDWTSGLSFSDPYRDERQADAAMGLGGARGFVSLLYAYGGDRYGDSAVLLWRISCALHPAVWAAPVQVSRAPVARGPSAVAARLVHCAGAPEPFPVAFYCAASPDGPRGVYCSAPWLERAPERTERGTAHVGRTSSLPAGRVYDVNGRLVGRISPGVRSPSLQRVPGLPPGVYVVQDGTCRARLTVVR